MKSIFYIIITAVIAIGSGYTIVKFSRQDFDSYTISLGQVRARPVSLLFVGDIMVGRYVEKLMNQKGDAYIFGNVDFLLKKYDAVVGNLEGPIPIVHKPTMAGGMKFSFASTTPKLLIKHNIKIVSLSNNHGFDQGQKGNLNTREVLTKENVEWFGNVYGIGTSSQIKYSLNGNNVSFVGFNLTDKNFNTRTAIDYITSKVDHTYPIFVFVHWGEEYTLVPSKSQINFARALVDAGVSAVIGHHPHVVQTVEFYKGKPIFYSLGNFVFDQYFSKDVQQSLVVSAKIYGQKITYDVVPLQSTQSAISLMDATSSSALLSRVGWSHRD